MEIKDINLKLALINTLMGDNLIPEFNIKSFFREILSREYDSNSDYNWIPIKSIEKYFAELYLKHEDLLSIRSLYVDGGDDIYHYIIPQWDGEDNYFNIRSLEGIQSCSSLRQIQIICMASISDFNPLVGLPFLEEVEVENIYDNIENEMVDLSPLLKIGSLQKFSFNLNKASDTLDNHRIIDKLLQNGMKIAITIS